jgi:hypothetical protein
MRILGLALAVSAAALAACSSSGGRASAGDRNEPVRALLSADALMFVSFDSDGDLSVSAAEINAGIEREFARADVNRDGQLPPLEFQNWSNAALGGGQIGPFRLDFDRNVDNVITRAEFETEVRARVSDYDANEDGALTRQEFVRLMGQARTPPPDSPDAPAGGAQRPPPR